MALYELVREIENQCERNQMRDIFFEEVETDDPLRYIQETVKGKQVELTPDVLENGNVTVFVKSGGVTQKFLFTKL